MIAAAFRLLETLLQDTRLALRLLRRSPGVTAIALLSITLSVGATAVVFTAIKSVVIDHFALRTSRRTRSDQGGIR